MAERRIMDAFANKAYATVTESAANTLTFTEIQSNVNILEKVAWVISRIEWYLATAIYPYLDTNGDVLQMALTASRSISTLALSDPAVIDLQELSYRLLTAVGFGYNINPWVRDFSGLPGGGLIVAPRPLFVAAKGTGLTTASTVACRIYFTQRELQKDEYFDLIDFYRIIS